MVMTESRSVERRIDSGCSKKKEKREKTIKRNMFSMNVSASLYSIHVYHTREIT